MIGELEAKPRQTNMWKRGYDRSGLIPNPRLGISHRLMPPGIGLASRYVHTNRKADARRCVAKTKRPLSSALDLRSTPRDLTYERECEAWNDQLVPYINFNYHGRCQYIFGSRLCAFLFSILSTWYTYLNKIYAIFVLPSLPTAILIRIKMKL